MSTPAPTTFHGDRDLNVDVDHSRKLDKALRRAKKPVEYIEYEGTDHYIGRQTDRIDMLQRIGDFLDKNLSRKSRIGKTVSRLNDSDKWVI
jgi:dipeptidyl aminopeptidase/acylaminoacyl peptidase